MRTKQAWSVSLFLLAAVALCPNSGCGKKGATGNTPPGAAPEAKPTPPVAQEKAAVQVSAAVKPAPSASTIAEGHAFPALEFASLGGTPVNLANLKGKVVLIDFWATWCGPCRKVLPDLVETYKEYHGQGFEIIGISLDKDQSPLQQYLEETGMTWPQYYDGLGWDNKMAQRFGVRAIPHIVLIDKNGAVHFNTDYDRQKPPLHGVELRNVVAKLCQGKG